MKPTDIEVPFQWDDRKIIIHDKVWYIPSYLTAPQPFDFPGWDSPQIFGNTQPIAVEYCSGNGLWIAEKAKNNPQTNWVAVERKYQRVRKIWSKIKNFQLDNLFVICGEALNATSTYFPSGSIQEIYINFPDPWPKNRHAKNRLIEENFIRQMERVLAKQGIVTFVTDDPPYSDWTVKAFSETPGFKPGFPSPHYLTELPDYGSSYFEDLWREKGKTIRYHQFIKASP